MKQRTGIARAPKQPASDSDMLTRAAVDLQESTPRVSPLAGHRFEKMSIRRPQPRLTVNQPGDSYEQEADATASQVMKMDTPEPAVDPQAAVSPHETVGRQVAREDVPEEEKKPPPPPDDEQVSRKETAESQNLQDADVSDTVSEGLQSGGTPLDTATRSFMEPRFGHDFSQVRIHTDAKAAQSAENVAARAYTVGSDIAFRSGEYNPGSSSGKQLLAHELTHVVQQTGCAELAGPAARKADRPASFQTPRYDAVQRDATLVPQPDWGDGGDSKVTFNPHAEISGTGMSAATWFPGKTRDKVTVPRDFTGTAKIVADCFWYYHEKHLLGDDRKSGMLTAETTVGLKVEKGKLAFVGNPTVSGGDGVPGFIDFVKTALPPSLAGDNDGSFGLTADFKATSAKTSSTTKTVGGSAEVTTGGTVGGAVGPVNVGGSTATKVGTSGSVAKTDSITTSGTGGAAGSFALDVHVLDAAGPQTKTKTAQVHFAESGSKKLDDAAPGILTGFYATLPKEVRDDIKAGKFRINLEGHADCKAGNMFNLQLSADRTLAVLKGLQLVDPELGEKNVSRLNLGEEGSTQDGKDHYEDRRVDLSVTYEEAPPVATSAGGGKP